MVRKRLKTEIPVKVKTSEMLKTFLKATLRNILGRSLLRHKMQQHKREVSGRGKPV